MNGTSNSSSQSTVINAVLFGNSLLQTPWPLIIFVWFEIVSAALIYGLGFLGNVLSLIVFYMETELRSVSTGILFLLITAFNAIHLWTLTTEFLGSFGVIVYSHPFFQCRLNFFVQNMSRAMSTYLVLIVTIDRLIRSEFPLQSRQICTPRNVLKLTLLHLAVFSLLFSFWFCPLNTMHPLLGICYTGDSAIYNYFINNIFFPARFVVVCVVPVIGMIGTNARILLNLQRSRRRVQDLIGPTPVIPPNGTVLFPMNALDRLLLMVMGVNVVTFILTQTPFHLSMIIRAYGSLNDQMYLLIRPMMLIWSSIYYGIGFYLYCLATPLFRKRSMKILRTLLHYRRTRLT